MLYSWPYRIVPVAREFGSLSAHGSECRIRDFDACRVRVFVQFGIAHEASASLGVPDEMTDDSPTHEQFATPGLCDVPQQTMRNLVPLAGARGKVADRDASADGICQRLPRPRPQADALAVTAASLCRHEQFWGCGIHPRAHRLPPAAERLRSNLGGVRIQPYTHPSMVGRDVVHTLGHALAAVLGDHIRAADLARVALGRPCPPRMLAIPEPCLFLRVSRDHRVPTLLQRLAWLGALRQWRMAVGMGTACLRFPVGWEAIMPRLEQPSDGGVAHVVAVLREGLRRDDGCFCWSIAEATAAPHA
jgi:hypothetical protein